MTTTRLPRPFAGTFNAFCSAVFEFRRVLLGTASTSTRFWHAEPAAWLRSRAVLQFASCLLLCCAGASGICQRAAAAAADEGGHGGAPECEAAACQKTTIPGPRSVRPCARAGDPHRVAWYAQPSRNKRDVFGYLGGHAAWRGEPRCPDEGTFGMDYGGLFSKNHIWLKWLHGRPSHQAGGSYRTDGPHLLSH